MSYNITLEKKEIIYIIKNLTYVDSTLSKKDPGQKIIKKLERLLKPIKISSRKQKGRNLQKWICQQIANFFHIKYDQQDDQCLIHSREMGQPGVDIILRGDIKNQFPFAIESKNSEQLNILQTIQQAKKNTDNKQDWIIVYKKKALQKPIVIMDWNCFIGMNKKILKGKCYGIC